MKPNYLLILQIINLLWSILIQTRAFQCCNQNFDISTITLSTYTAKTHHFNSENSIKPMKDASNPNDDEKQASILATMLHSRNSNNYNQYIITYMPVQPPINQNNLKKYRAIITSIQEKYSDISKIFARQQEKYGTLRKKPKHDLSPFFRAISKKLSTRKPFLLEDKKTKQKIITRMSPISQNEQRDINKKILSETTRYETSRTSLKIIRVIMILVLIIASSTTWNKFEFSYLRKFPFQQQYSPLSKISELRNNKKRYTAFLPTGYVTPSFTTWHTNKTANLWNFLFQEQYNHLSIITWNFLIHEQHGPLSIIKFVPKTSSTTRKPLTKYTRNDPIQPFTKQASLISKNILTKRDFLNKTTTQTETMTPANISTPPNTKPVPRRKNQEPTKLTLSNRKEKKASETLETPMSKLLPDGSYTFHHGPYRTDGDTEPMETDDNNKTTEVTPTKTTPTKTSHHITNPYKNSDKHKTKNSSALTLEQANALHQANFCYSFNKDGKFPVTNLFKAAKKAMPARVFQSILRPKRTKSTYPSDQKSLWYTIQKSIHDPFKKFFPSKKWEEHQKIEDYVFLGQEIFSPSNGNEDILLQKAYISCTHVSPELFEDFYDTKRGTLDLTPATAIWTAANKLLGSSWKLSKLPDPPPKKKMIQFKKDTNIDGPSMITSNCGRFITKTGVKSKDSKVSNQAVTHKAPRKFTTYLTIRTATVQGTQKEMVTSVIESFNKIVDMISNTDSSFVVYTHPVKHKTKSNPIVYHSKSQPYTTKEQLEKHVKSLFIRQEQRCWLKLYCGHNQVQELLACEEIEESLRSVDSSLSVDPIQAPVTKQLGYLLGSHTPTFEISHYNMVLNSVPKLQHHQVACYKRVIKLHPKESISKEAETRAVFIDGDASQATTLIPLLKAIFNSPLQKHVKDLPEGRKFRFVENSADPTKTHLFRDARTRQKQFLNMTDQCTISGIKDLDLAVDLDEPYNYMTLRQVLLGMKTKMEPSWPLFVSIEFSTWRQEIIAVYMKDVTDEAHTMLAHLPIYLEAKFGDNIWKWFTSTHKADLKDYYWDESLQRVVTDDDNCDDADFLRGLHGNKLTAWETVNEVDANTINQQQITFELDKSFAFTAPSGGAGFDDGNSLQTMNTGVSKATALAEQPHTNTEDDGCHSSEIVDLLNNSSSSEHSESESDSSGSDSDTSNQPTKTRTLRSSARKASTKQRPRVNPKNG